MKPVAAVEPAIIVIPLSRTIMMPDATIAITTKNRKEELRQAVASAVNQTARTEVLVLDDGSTDGTSELVRSEFPTVRLIHHDASKGLIVRRNELARAATAPIIVSIDDDAAFPSADTVAQTLVSFDHPRVAAVAIPFVNVRQSDHVWQRAPSADGVWVTGMYIGTAHAVRRDVFLARGGYREHFVHQTEEMDFCLRALAAGYVVRLGTADPIHHFESPRRSYARIDYYSRRNDILFSWHNVPTPLLPFHLTGNALNAVRNVVRVRRAKDQVLGYLAGWGGAAARVRDRAPVSVAAYRLFRRLKTGGPVRLDEIESLLPPLGPPDFGTALAAAPAAGETTGATR